MHGKVVITGIGRSGTSTLVKLLTELGLDTGFRPGSLLPLDEHLDKGAYKLTPFDQTCNAGLETYLNFYHCTEDLEKCPRIIKDPMLYNCMDTLTNYLLIERLIIPLRDTYEAALSRVKLGNGPGGKWEVENNVESEVEAQIRALERVTSKVVSDAVRLDIPITFIWFPRFVQDVDYCFRVLEPILEGISFDFFKEQFEKTLKKGI